MTSSTSQALDFTNYRCAFASLELSAYPECVRSTVQRMRHLRGNIPVIDQTVVLGKGKYGVVYKGEYVNQAQKKVICAVKIFTSIHDCRHEIKMYWKCAGLSSIAAFHGFFASNRSEPDSIAIDYVEGMTLWKAVKSLTVPSEIFEDSIELAWQLLKLLEALQTPAPNRKNTLIHTDLFFDNIFWNDRKLVVVDLGMMGEKGDLRNPVIQKIIARAPEIFLNQTVENNKGSSEEIRYDESVDMWSVGTLVHTKMTTALLMFVDEQKKYPYGQFEISTLVHRIGLPPASYLKTVVAARKFFEVSEDLSVSFNAELSKFDQRRSLVETHQKSPNFSPEILRFLQKIFVWNPAERITVKDALKDPIFKEKNNMSAMAPVKSTIDFTNYMSAFSDLKISEFPNCLKSTVERIRRLAQSTLHVNGDQVLGEGSYGRVYQGHYEDSQKKRFDCAIKVFDDSALCLDEAEMLWKCAGVVHAISFHGFAAINPKQEGDCNALVLDYIPHPTFDQQFIGNIIADAQEQIIELGRQLLTFLSAIQKAAPNRSEGVIFGDLAPSNIFWVDRMLTVIDFGMAIEMKRLVSPILQKPIFRAPEIFLNQRTEDNIQTDEAPRFDSRIDIWPIACIIHNEITGKFFVFQSDEELPHGYYEISALVGRLGLPPSAYLKNLVSTDKFFVQNPDGTYQMKEELSKLGKRKSLEQTHAESPISSPLILDFLKKVFVWNPDDRISVEDALKHPLFLKK